MLEITPFILILVPLVLQLIVGTKSIQHKNSLKFGRISIITIISHIILSYIAFKISDYNFTKQYEQYPNPARCGMPLLGITMACFFLLCVLLMVILIQFLIKKWRKEKL